MKPVDSKLKFYYAVSVLSLLFAVVGFGYNTWRLEVSEENTNIRTASFEVFNHLAALEQILYAAHYDKNQIEGNARKAWVKIGVVLDLSMLISPKVTHSCHQLKTSWQSSWQAYEQDEALLHQLVAEIDDIRTSIKDTLHNLN